MRARGRYRKLRRRQRLDIGCQPHSLSFPECRQIAPSQVTQGHRALVFTLFIKGLCRQFEVGQFLRRRGKQES